MEGTRLGRKQKDTQYYMKSLIGLAVMIVPGFVPAPEPITQAGMAMIGLFVGLIYLVACVDLIWPALTAIVVFSFYAKEIYPNSNMDTGMYETIIQSFGQWITVFMITVLLICEALSQVGLTRRLSLWFITRKLAKRGAWGFTFMLLLAGLVIASFMNPLPAAMTVIVCARELFKVLGFKEGDTWPRMIITCAPWVAGIGFAMTPIGHDLPLVVLAMTADKAGIAINIISYMCVGVPIGLMVFLAIFLYFKLIVKPDVSKFDDLDYDNIEKMRPGKMSAREKWVFATSIFILLFWLVPGFMSFIIPDAPITNFLNELTLIFPLLVALILFAIVRINGEPLLDIAKAAKNIPWETPFMFAGVILIALALSQDTTGLSAWLEMYIAPLIGGYGPVLAVIIMAVLSVFASNLLNSWGVAVVFVTIATPIALNLGLNPAILAVAIAVGSNLCFTTPAAFPVISLAITDSYCSTGFVLKHGIVMTIVTCVIIGVLIYPLGSLFL